MDSEHMEKQCSAKRDVAAVVLDPCFSNSSLNAWPEDRVSVSGSGLVIVKFCCFTKLTTSTVQYSVKPISPFICDWVLLWLLMCLCDDEGLATDEHRARSSNGVVFADQEARCSIR